MKRVSAILLGVLLVLVGQNGALGQSPPEPTMTLKSTFPVADPPQEFQVVQQVLDFPPGAWTPAHSHGGLVFVTIAHGQVTQFSDGKETTYKTGDTWTEVPGHAHQAGNTTSTPSRTLVTFLLPVGAQQTIPAQMANAHASTVKTIARVSRFGAPAVARPFDVVEMQLDFAPGEWLPSQSYGGPAFFTVLEGDLNLRASGADKTFKASDTWTENPGAFSVIGNTGTAAASAFVTVLLPNGAKLTTLESQPATLPQTGGELNALPLGLVMVSVLLIIAGGLLWRNIGLRAR
jgi:quercetin dioxygenase-like cupin family protein